MDQVLMAGRAFAASSWCVATHVLAVTTRSRGTVKPPVGTTRAAPGIIGDSITRIINHQLSIFAKVSL